MNKHKFSKPVEKSVVTVSIGLATVSDSKLSAEESIKWADKVIDEAKDTGRNKMCIAKL